MILRTLIIASLLLSACGKDGDDASAEQGEASSKESDEPDPDVEKAAFEKNVIPKLPKVAGVSFEAHIVEDNVIMAVPKGWKRDTKFPGKFDAPKEWGEGSQVNAGITCDGLCEPKAWGESVKKRLDRYRKGVFKTLEEKTLKDPPGQLLIVRDPRSSEPLLHVIAARYKDGLTRYYTCRAVLKGKAATLKDAMAQACVNNVALELRKEPPTKKKKAETDS